MAQQKVKPGQAPPATRPVQREAAPYVPLGDRQAFPSAGMPGISVRGWMIGRALEGLLAHKGAAGTETIAQDAISYADAVLALLEGEGTAPVQAPTVAPRAETPRPNPVAGPPGVR